MDQSFVKTRDRLETYFDQTALKAWEVLTSDTPVSRVRAKVRAGRDKMRNTLLRSLPNDLNGARILDAGCGTGQISCELAQRGAEVLGVDISASLIQIAKNRISIQLKDKVEFKVGDMLAKENGSFDYVVAMDSLIHYQKRDIVEALDTLGKRTRNSVLFTIAPNTLFLSTMLILGKAWPNSDRSPQIVPTSLKSLMLEFEKCQVPDKKKLSIIERVKASFYVSEALAYKR